MPDPLAGAGALIVQADRSLLLEVPHPGFEAARAQVSVFAELVSSPEHIHTYRLSPLSLWNAASAGYTKERILSLLEGLARYPVSTGVKEFVALTLDRFGQVLMSAGDDDSWLLVTVGDPDAALQLARARSLQPLWYEMAPGRFRVPLMHRGTLKQELMRLGFPVDDRGPLKTGEPLPLSLRRPAASGRPWDLRDYQRQASAAFWGDKGPGTGFGTLVLPCGAGKTLMGLALMAELQTSTLILVPNVTAVHQWREELLDKTDLKPEDIGEYTGESKDLKPVTIATYQVLVWRPDKTAPFPHFDVFQKRNWGFLIFDEVHLLPAPVFRVTAELQALRRVGLTATLVREDGAESDVFCLVGPKKFDVPWKDLEARGWIATARCIELRLPLPEPDRLTYALAAPREKVRLAAENRRKGHVARTLVDRHPGEGILIIGAYLDQLEVLARDLNAPLITGRTPQDRRDELYGAFRAGTLKVLVVSKVANFAVNLPDASVAIQVSGSFGSRQEEAQRLGRILRPKERGAHFYTLVSRNTVEEEFALHRQQFLTEQGYQYNLDLWSDEDFRHDPELG